ncbi:gamma-aminobutyraldehyde dehydrogenase [Blastococcus sp. BMG 814]|uniref:Gamma-aminobutyraldehyde dehydrogenase n=1 Tax=Blastococcus carthaginiensis TaxID=3050034 RepID=A0ABT9IDF7_9ACTN|nr:gamma-aminobutyraldehyde dehydrogenase [Blastococcus carthaginiensis]MDP5183617.1 gamma-aminobutyraldehyde dehydrogenase [Blastococcus carthaginiensis]
MHLPGGAHHIAGAFGDDDGPEQEVLDPSTGQVLWTYRADTPATVERAIDAAEAALPGWAGSTPVQRSTVLHALARELSAAAEELAQAETAQVGKPIRLSREFDVPGSVDNVVFFAGAARRLDGMAAAEWSGTHTSTIRREPVGVVGSIAPWNYPLQMAVWKVLPAIAAGNTIVLKPAENTPLTTLMLADAAARAGVPAGVLNVVNGPGPLTGESLVRSPRIAMTSFTGSTAVGRHIAALAAANGTRLHLELGGKAPFVVFADADLDAAVRGAVAGSLINSGQDCTAATRAYVHRSLFDEFVAGVAELMAAVRLGPTRDEDTDQGPLASFRQRDKVAAMVTRAVADGATVVTGGRAPGGELAGGAYFEPTLLVGADQRSEIVQSEVFGPVLVALPFDDDDEALALANDVPFGLAASAWTRDVFRAQRVGRELAAGTVWINDHIPIVSEMPHGGTKGSGYGKDMSVYSFDEYTQVKHVMSDITGTARKEWQDTVFRPR